jgi:hypothetical protein
MRGMESQLIRYSLRRLFITIAIIAGVLGGCTWFSTKLREARIDAVRKAYLDGRMTLEEARENVGDRVDFWPAQD